MFKKVLKILCLIPKWYLKLTVLILAFIGGAELILEVRKYQPLLTFTKQHKMKNTRKQVLKLIDQIVLNMALWKWKYALGLTDKKPGEVPEPKKSEEKKEETGV